MTDPADSQSEASSSLPPFSPFLPKDTDALRAAGISEEKLRAQLELLAKGQKFLTLDRPCTLNDGIIRLSPAERDSLRAVFAKAAEAGKVLQFTPASGAATRMFKALQAIQNREDAPSHATLAKEAEKAKESPKGNPDAKEFLEWWKGLKDFAFFPSLRHALASEGFNIDDLAAATEYRPVIAHLLGETGLGLSQRPKALIPFHLYADGPRTALEEHLAEAAGLLRDAEGICRIHLTVSPEHERPVLTHLEAARGRIETAGIRLDIGLSLQKPSTDTLAVDGENRPLRNADDTLALRPGGHGTLLENLRHTGGDIVFLRNIDNTLPAGGRREEALEWRRALGGYLLGLQERTFAHLRRLSIQAPGPGLEPVEEAAHFMADRLGTQLPEPIRPAPRDAQALEEKRAYLQRLLSRPLRVCAMVRNQGEPGGGPFWVRHKDGSVRLQIVESSQVDQASAAQRRIAEKATHFNPVDMVCGLRNQAGELFQLQDFVDPDTYLVVSKTKEGKPLKALELPGLWNGSMAFWNTAFVEIPVEMFNPAKTINDLLRPSHRVA